MTPKSSKSKTTSGIDQRFLNRELSWLAFNERVLDVACSPDTPLLEQLRFLGITGSNLDEFFKVRVGGLQMMVSDRRRTRDPSGRTPAQQLQASIGRAREIIERQYTFLNDTLMPGLAAVGIERKQPEQLSAKQSAETERRLREDWFPILTPMAVDADRPLPLLNETLIQHAVRLRGETSSKPKYALMSVPPGLGRIIALPYSEGYEYCLSEDLVANGIEMFFPGEQVLECVAFRITRNADLAVREDLAADLISHMEDVLDARLESSCVRLEIADEATRGLTRFLMTLFDVKSRDVFRISGPLNLASLASLVDEAGNQDLLFSSWPPQPIPQALPGADMFKVIQQRDLLLYHPYDTFEPVVRLIQQAAEDPDVLAIKQILYRTGRTSQVVAALERAAQNGKHVTAIVEVKARFDEARNIIRARELEQAGAQVIYGVKGLKTHAKLCVIVRREREGIVRYLHFGTGNYNEVTATLYSDVSYMTRDPDLGADGSSFFNAITGYSQPQSYRKLAAAPTDLRERLLQLIEAEIEQKKQGGKAVIVAKMNSLVDPEIIEKLYEASQAGVKIRINVRGICCLRPGVKGLSDNISVFSVIDRMLEHARICLFHHGGAQLVFISSADWMPRNLDRRIETLVPVTEKHAKAKLLNILDVHQKDTASRWDLQSDGTYERANPKSSKAVRSQEVLFRAARDRARRSKGMETTVFEPHLPQAS